MLVATIIGAVAALISAIVAVVGLIILIRRGKSIKIIVTTRMIWIPVCLMVGLTIVSGSLFRYGIMAHQSTDTSTYGFESGNMGWAPQETGDSQGVTEVAQSDRHKFGKHSLELTTDLEGGHATRSKGEAYVTISVRSLEDNPITVWVYVPKEALGDSKKPNGIQVFVKDSGWRGEYGAWWDITPETVDKWHEVTLTPSSMAPQGGSVTPGFDPTKIRAVGVKVAIGEGSSDVYKGPIYIDAVDLPE